MIFETNESNEITNKYVYNSSGQLLSMIVVGINTYTYHTNARGDVVAVTDSNNNIVAQYIYDNWGNIIEQSGSFANQNPYRYAGYRYDSETGLYYLMARYYNPNIGRFISRDTLQCSDDDLLNQNLYAYGNNNPVTNYDPDGHVTFKRGTDITNDFLKLCKNNGNIARNHLYNLKWFYYQVRNKGPWDYKQNLLYRTNRYIFLGTWFTGEDLGNVHYGYVGTALGCSQGLLLSAAGMAQLCAGTWQWKYISSFFDDPNDQRNIRLGVKLYHYYNKDPWYRVYL